MLLEIKQTQKLHKAFDGSALKSEIEKLKQKKRKAFDLMLEDQLSKDDLKEQAEFYDGEIARLTKEIAENQDMNATHKKQIDGIRGYIDKIKSTENADSANTEIYRELVNKIIVQRDRTVDIYLNCVPFGFRVKYHAYVARRIQVYDIFVDSCEVIA